MNDRWPNSNVAGGALIAATKNFTLTYGPKWKWKRLIPVRTSIGNVTSTTTLSNDSVPIVLSTFEADAIDGDTVLDTDVLILVPSITYQDANDEPVEVIPQVGDIFTDPKLNQSYSVVRRFEQDLSGETLLWGLHLRNAS